MKKVRVLILALVCLVIFAGCSCKHEWTEADCINPKICIQCGETEGKALGHNWTEATCTTARVCNTCDLTEGDPLGHAWIDATCDTAKTCAACGETVGETLEHVWVEATTEAPKTCTLCGATEGEKIATDPRFVTAEAEPFFGRWETELDLTGEDLGVEDFGGTLEGVYVMEFGSAGELKCYFTLTDEAAFREAMVEYYTAWYTARFEEEEIEEDVADAVAKVLVGCSVEEYAWSLIDEMDVNELVEDLLHDADMGDEWAGSFVYYVEGDQLYWDEEWKDEMDASKFELIGTTLMLDDYLDFTQTDPA